MACNVLFWGGFVDGDLALDPASADYVAGMPVEITSAGVKVTTASNPTKVIGVMKNDKSEDAISGPQAADTVNAADIGCGVIHGCNKLVLNTGKLLAGTETQPYAWPGTAHAWTEGDNMYVSAAGKWDNQAQHANDRSYGIVTKAPTAQGDTLEAYMNVG